jgi:uncharacterized protein DUF3500
MDEVRRERTLTRTTALQIAAAGAAGLALGARPALAAPSAGQAVADAASAFLASLSEAEAARARFSFTDSERTRWHWTAPALLPRKGLPLKDLTEPQRALALALLRSSVSARGYRKALDIMSLQGVLLAMDTGSDHYDPDLYYVSVFGTPGDRIWGWRFEGHHLSRHFTVVGGTVVPEPFFLGAWPTRTPSAFRSVGEGFRTMPREEDAAREIVRSLGPRLRHKAVFSSTSLTDHETQYDVRVEPLDPVGVLFRELPSGAQVRVMEIVRTYLSNHPLATARDALARIDRAGRGRIRFGWAGSTRPGQLHYYRLQGPTFLLEFDNSRNEATHIHSVWRDFQRDFGRHLIT